MRPPGGPAPPRTGAAPTGAGARPRTIEIDDPADPRIAVFRDIRERDVTGRGGLIAEGAVVLDQLLGSPRFRATALLVLRKRLAGLERRLADAPADLPVFVAGDAVFDAIAGFPVHRGVMAHGEALPGLPSAGETLAAIAGQGGVVVAAVGIGNHDNMGAIFRNAAAFGAGAVLLDATACDPLYRKAIRVSVGTALRMPFFRAGGAEGLHADLRAAGFRCFALTPAGALPVQALDGRGPTALFVGPEGAGLPAGLLAQMPGVRIDMAPGVDSLNVAVSAAIVLHHLAVSRRAAAAAP